MQNDINLICSTIYMPSYVMNIIDLCSSYFGKEKVTAGQEFDTGGFNVIAAQLTHHC